MATFAPFGLSARMGVAAEGLIVPGDGIVWVAAPGMAVVSELRVEVGDEVTAGQALAQLENHAALAAAVALAERQWEATRAREHALEAEKTAAEAELAVAWAGVAEARKGRTRALAEQMLGSTRLSRKITALEAILEEKSPPRREREEIEFEITQLEIERDIQDAGLSSLRDTMDARVEHAEARRAAMANRLEALGASRIQWEAEVAVAAAEWQRAQVALEQATVKSPRDGTVLAINARAGEAVGAAGLLWLGDLSRLYVEAEVYVDDLHRVRVGQAASIGGAALAHPLAGKVERIGLIIGSSALTHRDPAVLSDRQVVTVRVRIEDAAKLTVNTQVTVRIPADAE